MEYAWLWILIYNFLAIRWLLFRVNIMNAKTTHQIEIPFKMSQPNSIPPSNTPPSSEIPPGAAIIQKDANGRPSMFDVLKTIRLEELKLDNLAKTPCARDTLLYGIGGGLGMSVFRYWRTSKW